MKKLPLLLTLALVLGFTMVGSAQVKLTKGDLAELKSAKKINLEFTYDNMAVGKFDKEADYVAKKTGEYNEKEKGKGDRWAKNWVGDRAKRYQPTFEETFSKYSEREGGSFPDAEYTIIFNTTFTEPGFNIGIMRSNAYIDGKAILVETKNRDKVLAEFTIRKSPGRDVSGYDFDAGERIEEAYAKAGKEMGKLIKKKAKAKKKK